MLYGHGIRTDIPEVRGRFPHEELMESVLELAIADFMTPPKVVLVCGADGVKICNGGRGRKHQRCPRKGQAGCGPFEKIRDAQFASQATEWIMSDEEGLFSFVGICDTFGIDPSSARKELLRRKRAGERVSMKTLRFVVNRPRQTLFGHPIVVDPSLRSGEIVFGELR